jgi:hypothetical protein
LSSFPVGPTSSCQDFQKRFDIFFDGELDGRTMRDLALHVARCRSCEDDLRRAERVQELFADVVRSTVDRIDVASLWRSIEAGLDAPNPSLLRRIAERWQTRSRVETGVVTAFASAAIAAGLLVSLTPTQAPAPTAAVASAGPNRASIDRLESSAPAVAVWTEPDTQTTAIWVASYEQPAP